MTKHVEILIFDRETGEIKTRFRENLGSLNLEKRLHQYADGFMRVFLGQSKKDYSNCSILINAQDLPDYEVAELFSEHVCSI